MSSIQTLAQVENFIFTKVEAFDVLEGPGVLLMVPQDRRFPSVARGGKCLNQLSKLGERPIEPFDAFILKTSAPVTPAGLARDIRKLLKTHKPVITETTAPQARSIWRLVERKEKRCMFFTVSISHLSAAFPATVARIYRNKRGRVWNDKNIALKKLEDGTWTDKEVRARLKELRKLTKHGIYSVV